MRERDLGLHENRLRRKRARAKATGLYLGLLLSTASAWAQAEGTGNWLLENCRTAVALLDRMGLPGAPPVDPISAAKMATCIYYVKGVVEAAVFWGHGMETYCFVSRPNAQLVRAVTKGLTEDPLSLDKPAAGLVTSILMKAFARDESRCRPRS